MNVMSGLALPLRQRFAGRSLGALGAISLALLIVVCAAGRCEAQCVEQSDRVPVTVLQAFQFEPASLLRDVRNDRSKLTGRLAAYIVTDISILPSVHDLISESSNVERAAIGMALRRAQLVCVPRKPENAQKISQFVQKLADSAVSSGYSAELEAVEFDPNSVAGQTTGSAQTPPTKKPSDAANSLMTGEWSTEIGDPFTLAPLPQ
ncbi:hypothetical protein [Bradyrhizobium sp. CCBAU 51627]|uniref:hypothetical protein n=1 Tax=Bradyrhizobium sp. CCBAU 51627 TaxID=1325088 RepID=UPI0023066361|nr:hypothetical protein [Bradyrhizobium sp. CCBAU 51627]